MDCHVEFGLQHVMRDSLNVNWNMLLEEIRESLILGVYR